MIIDPQSSSTLYVATDFGVYRSTNTGGDWETLGTGLPNVVVTDLELHHPTRTLIAGTYGRSMWTYDLQAAVDATDLALSPADVNAPHLQPLRPNPAREAVEVRWVQPRAAEISIDVFDVAGRRVANLAQGRTEPGAHSRTWERRTNEGKEAVAGVYFVRLAGDGVARTRKLVLAE